MKEGDNYYIVYHRHDNPHSNRGFHRQIAIDKLEFNADGTIKPVVPTHEGINFHPELQGMKNLAFQAKVTASSYYDNDFRPEYAVDDNNGTLWKPRNTKGQAWIQIDLGKKQTIKTICTQFEYGTQFYQYIIETSNDGKTWQVFSDKLQNRLAGSPMVDFGNAKARYVRLTYTGGQKLGFGGAIWNIKVYGDVKDDAPQQWIGMTAADFHARMWKNNEGMLGGALKLQQGSAISERVKGKNAVTLAAHTTMVMQHDQLTSSDIHTFTASVCENGAWKQIDETDPRITLTDGRLQIASGNKPLTITNIRYYNWQQTEAEKAFDAETDIVRNDVANDRSRGLIVDICADSYNVNDTVPYITNGTSEDIAIKGEFEYQGDSVPVIVKEVAGKKAFCFTGKEWYRTNFMLPATIRDNAPYTIEAWILNPEMAENECVADFTSTHDELEKLMLVNGTEPRCGVMNHYGWYEDAGYKEVKTLEGKWQHVIVSFDGRIETVTINDKVVSQKDIQLLVKPSQFITLGKNAENEWPFSGYIHSLKLYDEYK